MQQPPYGQNPYGSGYGYAPMQASANVLDIIMGVLQIIASLLGVIGSALVAFGGAVVASGSLSVPQNTPSDSAITRMFGVGGGLVTAFGFILMGICLIYFCAGIGMIRFKKWAFIVTGVLILLQLGLAGYGLATQSQVWETSQWVFLGIEVFWMVYCFIRAPRAN